MARWFRISSPDARPNRAVYGTRFAYMSGMIEDVKRRLPVGAEAQRDGRTHFRVWAPRRHTVEVVLEGSAEGTFRLKAEERGYFAGFVPAGAGTRYRFRLDGDSQLFPDPASRFQ